MAEFSFYSLIYYYVSIFCKHAPGVIRKFIAKYSIPKKYAGNGDVPKSIKQSYSQLGWL